MIIAFVNRKGGCGKSTACVHFAYWCSTTKKKRKVLAVDCDEQASSAAWIQSMEGNKIATLTMTDTNDIIDKIPHLDESHDIVVVDSPAAAQEITRAILLVCDLAVIPVQPSGIDLHSTAETVRLVSQAQKVRGGSPMAAAFLSRAIKGTRLKNEAIAFLKEYPNILFLKSVIHQRVVVADTFGQDCTVWDFSNASDTQAEYQQLFAEMWRLAK